MVGPVALKVVRLTPTREFVYLGCLAQEVGWKYQAVTATLEEKGKEKAMIHHRKKQQLLQLWTQAAKNVEKETSKFTEVLKITQLLVLSQIKSSLGYLFLFVPQACPSSTTDGGWGQKVP